jgi:hypothetical protein
MAGILLAHAKECNRFAALPAGFNAVITGF